MISPECPHTSETWQLIACTKFFFCSENLYFRTRKLPHTPHTPQHMTVLSYLFQTKAESSLGKSLKDLFTFFFLGFGGASLSSCRAWLAHGEFSFGAETPKPFTHNTSRMYGNGNDEEWMRNDKRTSTDDDTKIFIFIFYVSISSCSSLLAQVDSLNSISLSRNFHLFNATQTEHEICVLFFFTFF